MDETKAMMCWLAVAKSRQDAFRRDLLNLAVRYARIRAEWRLGSNQDRQALESARTAAHNALIDSCNILSRAMAEAGESVGWRQALGDDRKVLGDFACYIHLFLGLEAR